MVAAEYHNIRVGSMDALQCVRVPDETRKPFNAKVCFLFATVCYQPESVERGTSKRTGSQAKYSDPRSLA